VGSLLLIAALLLAGDPTPVDDALAAFKGGEYGKAAEAAEKVKADDPLYPRARYLLGESRLALGDAAAAEKAFREGLEKKGESGPLLAGLGRALTAAGKPSEAAAPLEKALKADPKDPVAHRAMGECLAAQGKGPEARKSLETAFRLDPKDPLTCRALVEVLVKQDDLDAAEAYAGKVRAADPKGAMGEFLRGVVLDKRKKGKDAIEAYEAALAKDPKFLDAHKNLAILCVADNPGYTNRERTRKGLEHFAKYFELGGKDEELKQTYLTIKGYVEGNGGR
jgi:tetratricopeptide (TPR) repeat protein